MTKRDYIYFDAAREVARQSDYKRHQVGCVIVQKSRIISSGCNSHKTHPQQQAYNRFRSIDNSFPAKLHAEIKACIRLIGEDIRHSAIYVYRIRRDRPHGNARPCPSCMQMLRDLGIKNINYTTDDGFAQEYIS